MALCIPGDTLWLLGLEDLPAEFGVAMHVRGTAAGPRLAGVGRWGQGPGGTGGARLQHIIVV